VRLRASGPLRLCAEELISALAGALAIGAGQGRAVGGGGSQ
jgi:hypothetical protein